MYNKYLLTVESSSLTVGHNFLSTVDRCVSDPSTTVTKSEKNHMLNLNSGGSETFG